MFRKKLKPPGGGGEGTPVSSDRDDRMVGAKIKPQKKTKTKTPR